MTDFHSVLLFSEVCVDKARIDEYEQRASELAQKASIDKKASQIFIPLHIHYSTRKKQNPLRHAGIYSSLLYKITYIHIIKHQQREVNIILTIPRGLCYKK